ncbi:hypothetical protein CKX30_03130 [Brucella abortus]|nr:hypothetical protein CKX30_03130 [Brucella abortus]PXG06394.1 hypothetical protein DMP34_02650 [Brucella abortus]
MLAVADIINSGQQDFRRRCKTMAILFQLRDSVNVIREFVAPSYRPERHYMRGPGPACAARTGGR